MREHVQPAVQRNLIQKGFLKNVRVDGRSCMDFRDVRTTLGSQRGSCVTQVGRTKVLANVTAVIVEPRAVRQNEGELRIDVVLSPMGATQFESGRLGDVGIELTRLLERSIRESKCVDTESLCIITGEKAWSIRLTVTVLDHDGSLIDACSVAAITALLHFRRPDVTVTGETFEVHSVDDRDPVPLSIYHIPLCMTFGLYDSYVVCDPSADEYKTLNGSVVLAVNSHREVCTLHCGGRLLLAKRHIIDCMDIALDRAQLLTDNIREIIATDAAKRTRHRIPPGFVDLLDTNHARLTSMKKCMILQPPCSSTDFECENTGETGTSADFQSPLVNSTIVNKEPVRMTPCSDDEIQIVLERGVKKKDRKHVKLEDEDVAEILREIPAVVSEKPEKSASELRKEKARERKTKAKPKIDAELAELLEDVEKDVHIIRATELAQSNGS